MHGFMHTLFEPMSQRWHVAVAVVYALLISVLTIEEFEGAAGQSFNTNVGNWWPTDIILWVIAWYIAFRAGHTHHGDALVCAKCDH